MVQCQGTGWGCSPHRLLAVPTTHQQTEYQLRTSIIRCSSIIAFGVKRVKLSKICTYVQKTHAKIVVQLQYGTEAHYHVHHK